MDFFYHESGIKLPKKVALMPVHGSILMPHAHLSVPITEEQFLKIASIADEEDLFVGIVQPILDRNQEASEHLSVFSTATLGSITEISEAFEGNIAINISGVCRFDIQEEYAAKNGTRYAVANYERYLQDLQETVDVKINRKELLRALENYFRQHDVAPNWQEIDKTTDEHLITVLSMVCPFHAREKQALLEMPNIAMQSEMITKLIEFAKFDGVVSSASRH